ncbi:hypothetical protein ABH994_006591 [Bradyrhizobium yuanmingense]|uniref:ATP-binding protein n=1 Tax=Bradyrhizobium yuanmingense TaxID=108015 RepID=UPI0035116BAF
MAKQIRTVNIRPGVSVLSVLRHLNYRAWFALAEFVDNSVQSYLFSKSKLEAVEGNGFKLRVSIDIDATAPARIVIRDNASGIAQQDFPRAFRPAAIPPNRTGLSEFGMGMKSAACWFSSKWTVRTKALGDDKARLVKFDVSRIVTDQIEELEIEEATEDKDAHYTEVVLEELHHVPVKKTVAKIKEHLTDIYRVFIRNGVLELRFNGELLTVEEPSILVAQYVRDPDGESRKWQKDINFDFGDDLKVRGFAALRDPGNYSRSGFALFRRDRLIQGSGDEGYRPLFIFGQPGSFRSLRLFGELHLEGFEVSHTKDGFRWDENEQPFLELLKEHLDDDDLPLLRQADNYRAIAARGERAKAAKEAVERTTTALSESLPAVIADVADKAPVETPSASLQEQSTLAAKEISFKFRQENWTIKIELSDDPAESQWLAISDVVDQPSSTRVIEIRLSMTHPFMVSFAQTDPDDIEALLRVASALAVAEVLSRRGGVRLAGTVRRNVNDILREALSQPTT